MNRHHMLGMSKSAFLLSFVVCLITGRDAGASEGRYIDATSYLASHGQVDQVRRWMDASVRMADAFDDVCPDTFCEGDFSNWTPMSWRCSVQEETGALGQCVWMFAASAEFVDPQTGALTVESKTVPCWIPATGSVEALLDGLLNDHVDSSLLLRRALPSLDGTLYDALASCL